MFSDFKIFTYLLRILTGGSVHVTEYHCTDPNCTPRIIHGWITAAAHFKFVLGMDALVIHTCMSLVSGKWCLSLCILPLFGTKVWLNSCLWVYSLSIVRKRKTPKHCTRSSIATLQMPSVYVKCPNYNYSGWNNSFWNVFSSDILIQSLYVTASINTMDI